MSEERNCVSSSSRVPLFLRFLKTTREKAKLCSEEEVTFTPSPSPSFSLLLHSSSSPIEREEREEAGALLSERESRTFRTMPKEDGKRRRRKGRQEVAAVFWCCSSFLCLLLLLIAFQESSSLVQAFEHHSSDSSSPSSASAVHDHFAGEKSYQLPFYQDLSKKKADECYDERQRAKRCEPGLVNAAFERRVEVTNECGLRGRIRFCIQTGLFGKKDCEFCDAKDQRRRHPASYLTDHNDNNTHTWWQSESMFDGVQSKINPTITQVNLTLYLGRFSLSSLFCVFERKREGEM